VQALKIRGLRRQKVSNLPRAIKDLARNCKKAEVKTYTTISLLDKWLLLQAIVADPNLSSTAKVVAGVLLYCLNCKTGKCCPSLAYLAVRIGKKREKRRVISAAIAQLRQRGWVTSLPRRGSSYYYFAFDRLKDGVQEIASHETEGVRETACLEEQASAHEAAQESAHLNTGNVESGNRNRELVHPREVPSVRAVKGKQKQPRVRRTRLADD